ncbi:sensor histidine kinase [Anaerobacillus sp. 1_MG-2023]|uniref:sensor histidine kinase n=1 Tax=Anaerobacillus sp. 1_MG-2023 TaxID=3062655 RepID=UPI0034DF3CF9
MQTLVENAIVHGILKKPEGGEIIIRVKKRSSGYEVFIEDNGIGMTSEVINDIRHKNHSIECLEDRGIGLMNTNRRLKQLFGTELKISNRRVGSGTTVYFTIPKV